MWMRVARPGRRAGAKTTTRPPIPVERAGPPPLLLLAAAVGRVVSVLVVLGFWTDRGRCGSPSGVGGASRDRLLELPHAAAQRSADLGQPSCSEKKKDEEQEEQEMEWVLESAEHVCLGVDGVL
jgi:hypothetical protein